MGGVGVGDYLELGLFDIGVVGGEVCGFEYVIYVEFFFDDV